MGPLFSCSVTAVLQEVSLPAVDEGGGVTDDSQIVRLSDRVMAGRQLMTDEGRREETGGEEGSLAAIRLQSGEMWEVATAGRTDPEVLKWQLRIHWANRRHLYWMMMVSPEIKE